MKKILFILFILLFFAGKTVAIEEIVPDFTEETIIVDEKEESPLIKLFAQKEASFESGFINKIQYGLNYKGIVDFTTYNSEERLGASYDFYIEPYLHTYFGENKNQFRASILPTRSVGEMENKFTGIFSDLYYIRKFNDNHEVLIGHSRTPVGFEGGQSFYTIPFVQRSQIATRFGNSRALGVRFRGDFGYIDYDMGAYSSTRFLQHLNDGGEFTGWLGYNPFYNKKEHILQNLKLGGGLNYGHREENYTVLSTGIKWDYRKIFASAEYGFSQGYNGSLGQSNAKTQGGNATVGYNVTDKIQIVGRYDIFDPNLTLDDNNITQYSAGVNWFILKQRVRLGLNYIFEQQKNNNKNMIMLLTQFMI